MNDTNKLIKMTHELEQSTRNELAEINSPGWLLSIRPFMQPNKITSSTLMESPYHKVKDFTRIREETAQEYVKNSRAVWIPCNVLDILVLVAMRGGEVMYDVKTTHEEAIQRLIDADKKQQALMENIQ